MLGIFIGIPQDGYNINIKTRHRQPAGLSMTAQVEAARTLHTHEIGVTI
jgi:hypothetical protein